MDFSLSVVLPGAVMEASTQKVEKVRVYLVIYFLLMALLIGTVAASGLDLGGGNVLIALAIAVAKALLVILFFMHVRHGLRLTWIFAAAAFLWLSLLLGLTMTDYTSRGVVPGASKGHVASSPEQGHIPNLQNTP
jgi:cytochrome c oxidase subunit 4